MKAWFLAFRESKLASILWLIGLNLLAIAVIHGELYGEGLQGTVHFKFMGYAVYPAFFIPYAVATVFFIRRLKRD